MGIFRKIKRWLTGKKKCYYLHVAYKAQFSKFEWLESDKFCILRDYTLTELRLSIQKVIEKENGKQVKTLSLVNISELSKGLFDTLMRGETFNELQNKEK